MKTRFPAFCLILFLLTLPDFALGKSPEGGSLRGRPPESIMAGIFQPWSGPLRELGQLLPARGNYVFWINVPAQHPMDLRSAETFRRWVLPLPSSELSISHSMVAWRCDAGNGRWITGATGMTGGTSKQEKTMFLEGFGLSVFLSTFTDAFLQAEPEVGGYIERNKRNRGVVYTGFEVTGSQCRNMLSFLKRFVYHPSRPHRKFSFSRDPRKYEGASCVTLAAAMLEKAGILSDTIPLFRGSVKAPRYLAGGNIRLPEYVVPPDLPWLRGKSLRISYRQLRSTSWEYKSGPSVSMNFMDPEKMLYAQKQMGLVYLEQLPPSRRAREREMLLYSPLGNRIVESGNDSTGTLRIERYAVNDSFDHRMAQTGRLSRAWFRSRLREGFRIRREQVDGQPVLVLER